MGGFGKAGELWVRVQGELSGGEGKEGRGPGGEVTRDWGGRVLGHNKREQC